MYTDAATVLARVARVYGYSDPDALIAQSAQWSGICSDAATSASGLVHRVLLSKGYRADQIPLDSTIAELTSRIGCCHAQREGGLTRDESVEKVKMYCEACEKELTDYPLAGVEQLQTPAAPAIASGQLNYMKGFNRNRW